MSVQQPVRWYVVGSVGRNRELQIRDEARRHGYEAFVPLHYDIQSAKGREQRKLVPAIRGLVFVKGTLDEVKSYASCSSLGVFLRKSSFSRREDYLSVSPVAMENFIAVTEHHEEHVTYFSPSEITLREGDRIRVRGGLYDGREGVIMRVKGKRRRHFVVSIPGILIAAVEMTPDLIELSSGSSPSSQPSSVSRRVSSKEMDADKHELFTTARRLLFEIPDKYQHEAEYYLLLSNLRRLYARVSTYKSYTPVAEAELALSLYLASVKLGQEVDPATNRLRAALSSLRPNSLLRLRMQLFLAVLSGDAESLLQVRSQIESWSSTLSVRQRVLADELALVTTSSI